MEPRLDEEDAPLTGRETGPGESLYQPPVEPNSEGLGTEGPRDLDDLIVHTGEARGLADTARHSLELDAPTVGAAVLNDDLPEEDEAEREGISRSDNAPD